MTEEAISDRVNVPCVVSCVVDAPMLCGESDGDQERCVEVDKRSRKKGKKKLLRLWEETNHYCLVKSSLPITFPIKKTITSFFGWDIAIIHLLYRYLARKIRTKIT